MKSHRTLVPLVAALLAMTITGLPVGRCAIAWICMESTVAVERVSRLRSFSLDRFDPTCPQCM